ERYNTWLDRRGDLAAREITRTQREGPWLIDLARLYEWGVSRVRRRFPEQYGSDLVRAFRKHRESGKLEIITCGATHGFLPLMDDVPQAVRAQVVVGAQTHRRIVGADAVGIWLPECGYLPG